MLQAQAARSSLLMCVRLFRLINPSVGRLLHWARTVVFTVHETLPALSVQQLLLLSDMFITGLRVFLSDKKSSKIYSMTKVRVLEVSYFPCSDGSCLFRWQTLASFTLLFINHTLLTCKKVSAANPSDFLWPSNVWLLSPVGAAVGASLSAASSGRSSYDSWRCRCGIRLGPRCGPAGRPGGAGASCDAAGGGGGRGAGRRQWPLLHLARSIWYWSSYGSVHLQHICCASQCLWI